MGGLFSRSETKAGNQLLWAPKLDVVGYDKAFVRDRSSIASFWGCADHFRSTPESGHFGAPRHFAFAPGFKDPTTGMTPPSDATRPSRRQTPELVTTASTFAPLAKVSTRATIRLPPLDEVGMPGGANFIVPHQQEIVPSMWPPIHRRTVRSCATARYSQDGSRRKLPALVQTDRALSRADLP